MPLRDPKHVNAQPSAKRDQGHQQPRGLSRDFTTGPRPVDAQGRLASGVQRDPDPETWASIYCHRGFGGMFVSLRHETANRNMTTHFPRVSL